MKKNDINNELRGADRETLLNRLEQLRRELSRLQINASTSHVKDSSQYKKLRKNIARILAVFSQQHPVGKVL